MQSNQATNTLSPRNTKPSFSTCPRSISQASKAGLLADCVEQCSCGCAFSSFRSMTSASASQNTVMAVAPDFNRLPFSPGRSPGHPVCVLSCGLIIAQWILFVNYLVLRVRRMKTLKLPAEFSPPAACDVTRNVTRKEGKKVKRHKD